MVARAPTAELFDLVHVVGAVVPHVGQAVSLLVRRPGEATAELTPASVPAGRVAVLLFVSVEDARRLGALDLPGTPR